MSARLASHNYIVCNYFEIARTLTCEAESEAPERDRRGRTAVVIFMSLAAVEAYINISGRMWAEQNPSFEHSPKILKDLNNRKPITHKIKSWPKLLFNKELDLEEGSGKKFMDLIDTRNQLTHFKSEYHTHQFENVTISGLVDSTVFDSLTHKDAEAAVQTAETFIADWIRLQGLEEKHVVAAAASWTGNIERFR